MHKRKQNITPLPCVDVPLHPRALDGVQDGGEQCRAVRAQEPSYPQHFAELLDHDVLDFRDFGQSNVALKAGDVRRHRGQTALRGGGVAQVAERTDGL